MNGNSIGRIFRVTTWGESHGPALGAVVDGCPAGLSLSADDFLADMGLRQGGQGAHTTARKEADAVAIESGVFEGKTTGTPLSLRIANENVRSGDYDRYRDLLRPGHADFTTWKKHGHRDHRGGGRASARETTARVAAGVVAKKILGQQGIELLAFVRRIGSECVPFTEVPFHTESTEALLEQWWPRVRGWRNENPFRMPRADAQAFAHLAEQARAEGNSLGGSVECWVKGLPAGLGEPTFDKLNAMLAHALMSLPAAVAVEIGGGRAMSERSGSEIRDPIVASPTGARVGGNRHGGLLGGITTGEPLWLSLDFHAPTSIPRPIDSVDIKHLRSQSVQVEGRHDAVPLPRAVPMVEAMMAIILADALLLHKAARQSPRGY